MPRSKLLKSLSNLTALKVTFHNHRQGFLNLSECKAAKQLTSDGFIPIKAPPPQKRDNRRWIPLKL